MARGRMLNRKVTTDQQVAALGRHGGPWAIVLHHRLIAYLDVNGNTRADGHWLKANIFVHDGLSPDDCRSMVWLLAGCGLARLYRKEGIEYLHFPRFGENQPHLRREKERAEWPEPEECDFIEVPPTGGLQTGNGRSIGGLQTGNSTGEVEVEVEEEVEVEDPPLPPFEWGRVYEEIQKGFAELHRDFPNIPPIRSLNERRKTLVREKWKEQGFDWPQILTQIRASPFLRGDCDPLPGRNRFAVSFDFVFTRSSRWLEILEGKYDERRDRSLAEYESLVRSGG